jgi:hypothetical protein
MGENRNGNRVLVGNLEGRRALRKSSRKDDNIRMFPKSVSGYGLDSPGSIINIEVCKRLGVRRALSVCQLVKMSCVVGRK